jgi:uncharacterized RDD family membrane protein YckC
MRAQQSKRYGVAESIEWAGPMSRLEGSPPDVGGGRSAEPSAIRPIWSRPAALLVDTLVLGLIGMVLGRLLGPQIAVLGPWGRLIGLGIALVYYGALNSRLAGGQTPGKRLFGLRVIGGRGEPVGVGRAGVRAAIVLVPFYVSGLPISVPGTHVGTVQTLLAFGVGGALVYLYLFNRPTRRSLHDLVCGTLVVRASWRGTTGFGPLRSIHAVALGSWLGVLLIAVFIVLPAVLVPPGAPELEATHARLMRQPGVSQASITIGRSSGALGTGTWVRTVVRWRGPAASREAMIRDVAAIVLEGYPPAATVDNLVIVLQEGYDLGIWSSWDLVARALKPEEWKDRLNR